MDSQPAYLLHKVTPKKIFRRKTIAGYQQQLQIDLADVSSLAKDNSGTRFLLFAIDCFSRMAYVEPLLDKSARSVEIGFKKILKKMGYKPLNVQSDSGTEFVNKTFRSLMEKEKINFFSTKDSQIKCALVERLIRTIMMRLYRYFTKNNTHRFLDVLPYIIESYNSTTHSTLGFSPKQVSPKNIEVIWNRLYKPRKVKKKYHQKIKEGDFVRIPKTKKSFTKGFRSNWTGEIFLVRQILNTEPPTFNLSDLLGENIEGIFYREELLKTPFPDSFEIEEIIDKKKDKYLVRWKFYPKKFDSWVSKKDLN